MNEVLTVQEVADLLRLSKDTVNGYRKPGRLKGHKAPGCNGSIRFIRDEDLAQVRSWGDPTQRRQVEYR